MHRKVPVRFGPGAAGKGPEPQAPRRRPTGVTPDSARPSATPPDAKAGLICGNQTYYDVIRRNRAAWHADGQGFESLALRLAPEGRATPENGMISIARASRVKPNTPPGGPV